MTLTAARLRELLHYDPATGIFIRAKAIAKFGAGETAGALTKLGHIRICVDGRSYYAHRLAWLYAHGSWPSENIDHINGNPSDNRLINLRDVSQEMNNQNQRRAHSDNPNKVQGVTFVKAKGRFRASITVNYKARFLGYFDTPEEAHERYLAEKRIHHPGCTI